MPETALPPQIPWAKQVVVTKEALAMPSITAVRRSPGDIIWVNLSKPEYKITAEVGYDGDVTLEIDSKDVAERSSISKDEDLTRRFRRYYKERGAHSFIEAATDWIKGEPIEQLPPWGHKAPGVLDWVPGYRPPRWPKIGKIGGYGSGSSSDIAENWIGSSFPYVHFITREGDEGLVVDWTDGPPEVWTGYVDEFVSMNIEDFDSWESYAGYNESFENGFLWALDRMDVFEKGEIPTWAVKTIASDPDLLWPELVKKLVPILEALPADLEKAIRVWINRRQREEEKETGQVYLWPPMAEEHARLHEQYPILASLIGQGLIEIQDREYIGKSPERGEVNIGTVGFEAQAEQYLRARPTPDMW